MAPAYLISLPPEGGYDLEAMKEYVQEARKIVESFGGEYLVRNQETRTLEGDWDFRRIVLMRFPSMERLMEFYDSEEYAPWLARRKAAGGGEGRVIVFE